MRFITKEGLEKLKEELNYLKKNKRKEVAVKLNHAISFGDLSENAAYDEAKEDQAFVEGRIRDLENLIRNSSIVDDSLMGAEFVHVGSEVILSFNGKEEKFIIVGNTEVDPMENKISEDSLLGKKMINKKVGDSFELELPDGEKINYKIKNIK